MIIHGRAAQRVDAEIVEIVCSSKAGHSGAVLRPRVGRWRWISVSRPARERRVLLDACIHRSDCHVVRAFCSHKAHAHAAGLRTPTKPIILEVGAIFNHGLKLNRLL